MCSRSAAIAGASTGTARKVSTAESWIDVVTARGPMAERMEREKSLAGPVSRFDETVRQ